MQGFVLCRSEERSSRVCDEFVGNGEFLAEPGQALGLRGEEVVDCQSHLDGGYVMSKGLAPTRLAKGLRGLTKGSVVGGSLWLLFVLLVLY